MASGHDCSVANYCRLCELARKKGNLLYCRFKTTLTTLSLLKMVQVGLFSLFLFLQLSELKLHFFLPLS